MAEDDHPPDGLGGAWEDDLVLAQLRPATGYDEGLLSSYPLKFGRNKIGSGKSKTGNVVTISNSNVSAQQAEIEIRLEADGRASYYLYVKTKGTRTFLRENGETPLKPSQPYALNPAGTVIRFSTLDLQFSLCPLAELQPLGDSTVRSTQTLQRQSSRIRSSYPLYIGVNTIGRDPVCSACIDDPSLSGVHCQIELVPEQDALLTAFVTDKSEAASTAIVVDSQTKTPCRDEEEIFSKNCIQFSDGFDFVYAQDPAMQRVRARFVTLGKVKLSRALKDAETCQSVNLLESLIVLADAVSFADRCLPELESDLMSAKECFALLQSKQQTNSEMMQSIQEAVDAKPFDLDALRTAAKPAVDCRTLNREIEMLADESEHCALHLLQFVFDKLSADISEVCGDLSKYDTDFETQYSTSKSNYQKMRSTLDNAFDRLERLRKQQNSAEESNQHREVGRLEPEIADAQKVFDDLKASLPLDDAEALFRQLDVQKAVKPELEDRLCVYEAEANVLHGKLVALTPLLDVPADIALIMNQSSCGQAEAEKALESEGDVVSAVMLVQAQAEVAERRAAEDQRRLREEENAAAAETEASNSARLSEVKMSSLQLIELQEAKEEDERIAELRRELLASKSEELATARLASERDSPSTTVDEGPSPLKSLWKQQTRETGSGSQQPSRRRQASSRFQALRQQGAAADLAPVASSHALTLSEPITPVLPITAEAPQVAVGGSGLKTAAQSSTHETDTTVSLAIVQDVAQVQADNSGTPSTDVAVVVSSQRDVVLSNSDSRPLSTHGSVHCLTSEKHESAVRNIQQTFRGWLSRRLTPIPLHARSSVHWNCCNGFTASMSNAGPIVETFTGELSRVTGVPDYYSTFTFTIAPQHTGQCVRVLAESMGVSLFVSRKDMTPQPTKHQNQFSNNDLPATIVIDGESDLKSGMEYFVGISGRSPVKYRVSLRFGEWKSDRPWSSSGYICAKGCSYVGSVKNGLPDQGEGSWTTETGTVMKGVWTGQGKAKGSFSQQGLALFYRGAWEMNYNKVKSPVSCEGFGTRLSDGAVYRGGFRYGQAHGAGTLSINNGQVVHKGTFAQDQLVNGSIVDHSAEQGSYGSPYSGEWKQGQHHGTGSIVLPSGDSYSGGWFEGQWHGDGVAVQYAGGKEYGTGDWERFEGGFEKGRRDGVGKLTTNAGVQYDGQWQNGNQHGKGTTWLQTGANVTQSFDNNKPQNGDCRYEFFDGRVYEGEWEGTKMKAGRALMTYPDSMGVFQGQFRCTKPRDYPSSDLDLAREGKGKLTRPEGITLEGDWKKDSWVEGVWVKSESTQSSTWQGGRVVHGNGDLYFGHLKESRKKHGEGEMKFVSGRVYRGQWADDRMDGKGTMTELNGDVYTGEMHMNQRWGQGQLVQPNGEVITGTWKANVPVDVHTSWLAEMEKQRRAEEVIVAKQRAAEEKVARDAAELAENAARISAEAAELERQERLVRVDVHVFGEGLKNMAGHMWITFHSKTCAASKRYSLSRKVDPEDAGSDVAGVLYKVLLDECLVDTETQETTTCIGDIVAITFSTDKPGWSADNITVTYHCADTGSQKCMPGDSLSCPWPFNPATRCYERLLLTAGTKANDEPNVPRNRWLVVLTTSENSDAGFPGSVRLSLHGTRTAMTSSTCLDPLSPIFQPSQLEAFVLDRSDLTGDPLGSVKGVTVFSTAPGWMPERVRTVQEGGFTETSSNEGEGGSDGVGDYTVPQSKGEAISAKEDWDRSWEMSTLQELTEASSNEWKSRHFPFVPEELTMDFSNYRLTVTANNRADRWGVRNITFFGPGDDPIPTPVDVAGQIVSTAEAHTREARHAFDGSAETMFMSPKRITSGALTYRFRLPVRVLGYELQGISTSKTGLSTSPDPCDWILEATNDPDGDECWQLIDVQQNHNPESWAAASSDDQRKRFQIRTDFVDLDDEKTAELLEAKISEAAEIEAQLQKQIDNAVRELDYWTNKVAPKQIELREKTGASNDMESQVSKHANAVDILKYYMRASTDAVALGQNIPVCPQLPV